MKKLTFGLLGAVALLIGVALVGPSFMDWNQYKTEIAERVREATGRDFAIDGDIKAVVLPAPMLALNGVRLANAKGGAAKDMINLKAVEVRVALLPLLTGQIQVETVRLLSPVIELERFADERANWQFGVETSAPTKATSPASGQDESESAAQEASAQFPVRIDAFEIIDGTVRLRDGSGSVEEIYGIDATISAASLIGPFEGKGALVARGVPLNLEASIGKMIQGRTLPFALSVRFGGAGDEAIKGTVSGSLVGLNADPKVKAKLAISGSSLANLVALAPTRAGAQTTVPGFLGREFTVNTVVHADANAVTFNEIAVRLGDTRATGSAQISLGATPDVTAKLAIQTIDLNDWLNAKDVIVTAAALPVRYRAGNGQTSSASAVLAQAVGSKASGQSRADSFSLPADLRVAMDITAQTIAYGNGLIRRAQVSLTLADAQLAINQASAQLPGSTDVALFGIASTPDGAPRFDGDVDVTAADLRGLLSWLNLAIPDVPADRLRRLAFKAKLTATADTVSGSDMTIAFDSSKLTGGFAVALTKRLSFGLGARLDTLNLDAYLTRPAVTPATGKSPGGKAAKIDPWSALKVLAGFDANLDLRIDRLRTMGETARDLHLDGTLHAGTLTLRSLSVGEFAGATGTVTGQISNLAGVPKARDTKISVSAKNTAKLFKLLGATPPAPPANLGATTASVQIDGSFLTPKVRAKVNAVGGELRLAGDFSPLDLLTGVSVDLSVSHPDLYALTRSLALNYAPAKNVGGIQLAARVTGSEKSIKIEDLTGSVGTTAIAGNISVGNLGGSGGRPTIGAGLRFDDLVVDPYLPAGIRAKNRAAKQRRKAATRNAGQKTAAKRWSREPLDLSALTIFDGTVKIAGKSLTYDRFKLSDAKLNATLRDGNLTLSRLTGNLFSGRIDGTAALSANTSSTSGRIVLKNARMGDMISAATGKRNAEGVLNFTADLSTRGNSEFDMVSSLTGTGRFALTGVELKDKNAQGSAMAGLLNLLGAMNTMAGGFLVDQGGSKDGTSSLIGTFDAQNGLVRSTDMKLVSGMGNGVAQGTVDLPNWTLDARGEIQMKRNLLTALLGAKIRLPDVVPFFLSGPLDAPNVKLGTKRASQSSGSPTPSAAPATGVGATELQRRQGTTAPAPTPAPTQPEKINPFDILNKLLR